MWVVSGKLFFFSTAVEMLGFYFLPFLSALLAWQTLLPGIEMACEQVNFGLLMCFRVMVSLSRSFVAEMRSAAN